MKNILFLLHLPPPVHGSSIIGQSIRESRMINQNFNGKYINLLASKQVMEAGKVNIHKLVFFLRTWLKVFFSLLKHRPDLCYLALTTTGVAFYKDLFLIALFRIFGIKRVYHLHNKGLNLHLNQLFFRDCCRFAFKNAEVILLSTHLYSDILLWVPMEKIHICPNGIAGDHQEIAISQKYTGNKVSLLFLSNLIVSKGIDVLLEACLQLKEMGTSFECICIGDEGELSASEFNMQIKRLELSEQVIYKGKKYGKDKNEAFNTADIFIHPTYSDCFPLVILEAMSHSIPVISTLEGGIPDIVDNGTTGFLVPPKNASILAEKMDLLIRDAALRLRMGEAGKEKYNKEFTLQKFEYRLKSILQHLTEDQNQLQ